MVRSAQGQKLAAEHPQVVIDFNNIEVQDINSVEIEASISQGNIIEAHVAPNPYEQGLRAFVTFDPDNANSAELRVQLKHDDTPLAATWLYRWLK